MSNKWALTGFLVVAFCGAIAFVGAQERSNQTAQTATHRSSNTTSSATEGDLSWQLRNAQQAVVREYARRGQAAPPAQMPTQLQSNGGVQQAGFAAPLNSNGQVMQTAGYLPQDGDPEVPAILSGKPRNAGGATPTRASTEPASNKVPTSTGPSPAPIGPTPASPTPAVGPTASNTETGSAPRMLPGSQGTTGDRSGFPTARPIQQPTAADNQGQLNLPTPANLQAAPTEQPLNPMPLAQPSATSDQTASPMANQLATPGPEAHTAALNPIPNNTIPNNTIPSNAAATSPAPTTTAPANASAAALSFDSIGSQLRVMTDGPKSIKVGKPATYRIRTSNLSNVPAENVTVQIELPEWATIIDTNVSNGQIDRGIESDGSMIEWVLPQVGAVSVHELELQILVKENKPFDLNVAWRAESQKASGRVMVTQPKLDLQIAGPSEINYGETAVFTVTVANVGNGEAENVAVSLPESLGGQRTAIGNIPAGKSQSFDVELTAREEGTLTVSANATGDGDLAEVFDHAITVHRGQLEVELTAPEFKFAGSLVGYRISIANTGDAAAKEVMAAIALPTGAEYRAGVEGAEQVEGGLRWSVGDLAPGARLQYDLQVVLNEAGNNQIEGGARDSGGLAARDAAETMVEAVAELTLDVNDPKGPRAVGEEVVYELIIRNRGTKTAHNVNLVAQFSAGIDPTEGVGQESKIADGQVIFDPITTVAAGQEIRLKVKAKAADEGNHIFRAHLTSDNPETHRVFEGTTRYFDLRNGGTTTSTESGASQGGLNSPSNGQSTGIPTLGGGQPSLRMPTNK